MPNCFMTLEMLLRCRWRASSIAFVTNSTPRAVSPPAGASAPSGSTKPTTSVALLKLTLRRAPAIELLEPAIELLDARKQLRRRPMPSLATVAALAAVDKSSGSAAAFTTVPSGGVARPGVMCPERGVARPGVMRPERSSAKSAGSRYAAVAPKLLAEVGVSASCSGASKFSCRRRSKASVSASWTVSRSSAKPAPFRKAVATRTASKLYRSLSSKPSHARSAISPSRASSESLLEKELQSESPSRAK
mmetsp:Transcript_74993/g.145120  ORF Transcript_74993/g.145120 Transcript_74993/m.145120 type:complete len:248 (+) Transcript_74993:617-1360(+)